MKRASGRLVARSAIALIAALLAGVGCLSARPTLVAPDVPDAIRAPLNETPALSLRAEGFQIYECRPKKDDPARFEWVFVEPEATLLDEADRPVGRHGAGPTWESDDGSQVVGQVRAKADAPEPDAVQWLLLDAKAHAGNGVFSRVTSIQRVATSGGKPPIDGCDAAGAGRRARVPYRATYYFYVRRP